MPCASVLNIKPSYKHPPHLSLCRVCLAGRGRRESHPARYRAGARHLRQNVRSRHSAHSRRREWRSAVAAFPVVALTAEDAETEGEVSVTYWVRLLLITKTKAVGAKGGKHWSTHPIVDHAARRRGRLEQKVRGVL